MSELLVEQSEITSASTTSTKARSTTVIIPQKTVLGRRPGLTAFALGASDVICLSMAVGFSLLVSRLAGHPLQSVITLRYLIVVPVTIFVLAMAKLYPAAGIGVLEESWRVFKCVSVVQLGSICGLLALGAATNRLQTFSAWAISMAIVPMGRSVTRRLFSRSSWWGESVLLIGSGEPLEELHALLKHHPRFGLSAAAVLNESGEPTRTGLPEFESAVAGLEFARRRKIRTAVVSLGGPGGLSVPEMARKYASTFVSIIFVPPISPWCNLRSRAGVLGGCHTIRVQHGLSMWAPRALKRCMDLLIALTASLFLLPLMLVIAAAIKLTSRGPVVFGHERIGRNGFPFRVWKFRTMRVNADAVLAQKLASDPALRREWEKDHKLRVDPRVTKVGAVLRKLSLDELPQLWNVIRADMSIVGPRPIITAEIARYGEYFDDYARVRPGITGLWQVSGRNSTTYKERVQLDVHYVNNWSPWLDIYIIARTARAVTSGHGAY